MAITYSSSGNGSDIHKLATLITAFNSERKNYLTNSTDGLVGKHLADLNTHFRSNGLNQNGSNAADIVETEIFARRQVLESRRAVFKRALDAYLQSQIAYEGNAFSVQMDDVFAALYADMATNSKRFDSQAASIAEDGIPNRHLHVSNIHAAETWANGGTVKLIRYAGDVANESIVARVTSPQSVTGALTMSLRGEFPGGEAERYPDQANGWGAIGQTHGTGWNQGGLVDNNMALNTGSGDEFAAGWRGFTGSPASTAPTTSRVVRNTTAGVPYYGRSCFEFDGGGSETEITMAQVLNNPLRNLNTTAWGTSANNSSIGRIQTQNEGRVVFVSFRYRNLKTGYTLLPRFIVDGSAVEMDEIILDTVKDDSNTWRKAVFAVTIKQGWGGKQVIFGLRLYNGGSAINASVATRVDVLKVESGIVMGNFWFCPPVPDIVPLGLQGADTFSITITSAKKWETFWARNYNDRFGQGVQLRSGTPTEAESLIGFVDE